MHSASFAKKKAEWTRLVLACTELRLRNCQGLASGRSLCSVQDLKRSTASSRQGVPIAGVLVLKLHCAVCPAVVVS